MPAPTIGIWGGDAPFHIKRKRVMSDYIRRILQEQESLKRALDPFSALQRQVDGHAKLYAQLGARGDAVESLRLEQERRDQALGLLGGGSVAQAALRIEQADLYAKLGARGGIIESLRLEEERRDQALGLLGAGSVAQAARHIEMHGGVGEQASKSSAPFYHIDQQSNLVRLATEAASVKIAYEQSFRLPLATELSQLVNAALSESKLAREILGSNGAMKSVLSGMHRPWAHIGEEIISASAMAEIVAMGRGIDVKGAFNEDFAAALRGNLGDWRDVALPPGTSMLRLVDRMELYGEMGVNPALSDFPSSAFEESLRSAELIEGDEAESSSDEDDDARALDAFERLREFEVAMRSFITRKLREEFGDKWILRQIPQAMREDWEFKRAKEGQRDGGELPLIDYADFADYKTIIEKKDNWNRVFKPVFGRSEDIRESLQRLFPVRIATMHARPIAQDDMLLLLVETKRVLKAIGKA